MIVPKQAYQCGPGPWGELEYYFTFLEAPEETINLLPIPSEVSAWRFVGLSAEEIRNLFIKAGLQDAHLAALLEEKRWSAAGEVVTVYPPREVVFALTPAQRGAIYRVLAQWRENIQHREPAVIENGNVREWFRDSGLREEVLAAIENLAYPIGRALVFSDVAYVLGEIREEKEQRALMKALTRTRTMILRMRLSERSNLRELEDYWTVGAKYKDTAPMMRSVVQTPGVELLDVVHLLPPTARKLLYTYPTLAMGLEGRFPDCHWTCANFFNYNAADRFLDANGAMARFRESLDPVPAPYRFGDTIMLMKGTQVFHNCIFIADDIVYTKNGTRIQDPWILMKFGDMLARHQQGGEFAIQGYRER